MIYKVGEVWYSDEVKAYVKCVRDKFKYGSLISCSCCVFSEDNNPCASCTTRSYNDHPCYPSDRKDDEFVHFVLASEEEIKDTLKLKVGDKVLWADKRTPIGKERVYEVFEVFEVRDDMVKIADEYSEAEVPYMEVIKLED